MNQPKERTVTPPIAQPIQPVTPIDRLSKFAVRLRDLANDMETAALELALIMCLVTQL